MVAKITFPKRVVAALNYNENKVNQGKAECLYAGNFLKDANAMNFYIKLAGFERQNELNERAQTKTIHISLNFDPSEKLSADKLVKIAADYMEKIGFGDHPFLVYQHQDAGHPHIHIVSTTIKKDGSRINTHNIGRNQSEKARKKIEAVYGLIRAEDQKRLQKNNITPVNAEKLTCGKTETKKGINNVVVAVLNTYKFASLPEYNAVLKQYNVVADRGKEEGRIYKHRGLVYRMLDEKGNKTGVPIKASSINSQPTLDKLEKLFVLNEAKKEPFKQQLKATIDEILVKKPASMNELVKLLAQKNVYTVLRQNAEGRIYGITFVGNTHKTVFNGSDLGKTYSAVHLQNSILSMKAETGIEKEQTTASKSSTFQQEKNISIEKEQSASNTNTEALDDLLSAKNQQDFIPFQLLKKKRKRKRRSLGL
ncbi:MAG: relaxase/mobilization nuclease domain-containing protein [Chitinophagaceae bacterium]